MSELERLRDDNARLREDLRTAAEHLRRLADVAAVSKQSVLATWALEWAAEAEAAAKDQRHGPLP